MTVHNKEVVYRCGTVPYSHHLASAYATDNQKPGVVSFKEIVHYQPLKHVTEDQQQLTSHHSSFFIETRRRGEGPQNCIGFVIIPTDRLPYSFKFPPSSPNI